MANKDRRVERELNKRKEQDFQEIVALVLKSPIRRDVPMQYADGTLSMDELSHMNTDVQTRIIAQMAYNAGMGDVKAAQFLMDYGGLKPAQRQEVTLDIPQLVDDMTDRLSPVPSSPLALGGEDEEDEE